MEELFDVIVKENVISGKTEIFKIHAYKGLTEDEANAKIKELKANTKNRKFETPESIKMFAKEEQFIDQFPNAFHKQIVSRVYDEYCYYCECNNHIPETKVIFSKNICSAFGYKTISKHFSAEEVWGSGLEPGSRRIYIKI